MPVRPYDQNQQFLLPPSLNEWVKKSHPARVFSDIVDRIDISAFQEIKIDTHAFTGVVLSGIQASLVLCLPFLAFEYIS
jgi:hypothetical protein